MVHLSVKEEKSKAGQADIQKHSNLQRWRRCEGWRVVHHSGFLQSVVCITRRFQKLQIIGCKPIKKNVGWREHWNIITTWQEWQRGCSAGRRKFITEQNKNKTTKMAASGSNLVGTQVPDVKIDLVFGNPGDVSLRERCAGKKIIIVGLPGAFTPT